MQIAAGFGFVGAAVVGGAVLGAATGFGLAGAVAYGTFVGAPIGAGAYNFLLTLDPDLPHFTTENFVSLFWEAPGYAGSGEGGGGGAGGGNAGGIQGGVGNPPGPDSPNWGDMHPETRQNRYLDVRMCRDMCSGSPLSAAGSIYGLGSLTFSIALSFAGAGW